MTEELQKENIEESEKKESQSKVLTIPNMLSLLRIIMVPFIIWFYCDKKEYVITGIIIILSALTDVVDGFLARRFNMVSDLGKVLDPIADKLTQGATLLCLVSRFENLWIPLLLLIVKEAFAFITGTIRVKRTNKVHSADWHGKLATVLIYASMMLHIFWWDINAVVSNVLSVTCSVAIVLSGVMYGIANIKNIILANKEKK